MSALSIHVVDVTAGGEAVADQIADAGYTVSGPTSPDEATIESLAHAITSAPGADVVVVHGGCGARGGFAGALEQVGARVLPGVGERIRHVAEPVLGVGAMLLCCEAGFVGERLVIGIPEHPQLALDVIARLLLPSLPALFPLEAVPADEQAPVIEQAPAESSSSSSTSSGSESKPLKAAASPTGAKGLSIGLSAVTSEAPPVEEEAPATRGWLAAVQALKGEVHIGRREELPEPIEKLAPVVNVLNTAGEFGMLRLPSGRRYGLYGWPDLRRAGSKVIALSWGEPLAEMVVLHRHPHPVGTTIEGGLGLLPSADSDVVDACERATGRAPDDTSGRLFALESDTVWILRGRRVYKWDGRRERDDGSPKQVLASLTLRWSNH